jgi:RNA-directed DNA polymerase
MTVGSIRQRIGEAPFLGNLQQQLRTGSYKPSPCRRKLIPKPGKPGKFRPLGIPTIADRPGRFLWIKQGRGHKFCHIFCLA